jgi:Putative zinc-finger
MHTQHPTDRRIAALFDGRLDEAEASGLRNHIASCPLCQLRAGQAEGAGPAELPTDVQPAEAVLPPLGTFEDRGSVPTPGDVWRLVWDDINELGVVDAVDADRQRIFIMPVLADVDTADEWCAFASLGVLQSVYDVAVSVALGASIPWLVLDAKVGQIDMEELNELRATYKHGIEPDDDFIPRGMPVLSPFDNRLDALGTLSDAFHVLAQADWGIEHVAAHGVAVENLSFDALVDAGISNRRALALVRGDAAPTKDEARLIDTQAVTFTSPVSRPIPDELRHELNQPRYRERLRARARSNQRAEADERVAVAYEVMEPTAARGTQGERPPWAVLLERALG